MANRNKNCKSKRAKPAKAKKPSVCVTRRPIDKRSRKQTSKRQKDDKINISCGAIIAHLNKCKKCQNKLCCTVPGLQFPIFSMFFKRVLERHRRQGGCLEVRDVMIMAAKCWKSLTKSQQKHFRRLVVEGRIHDDEEANENRCNPPGQATDTCPGCSTSGNTPPPIPNVEGSMYGRPYLPKDDSVQGFRPSQVSQWNVHPLITPTDTHDTHQMTNHTSPGNNTTQNPSDRDMKVWHTERYINSCVHNGNNNQDTMQRSNLWAVQGFALGRSVLNYFSVGQLVPRFSPSSTSLTVQNPNATVNKYTCTQMFQRPDSD